MRLREYEIVRASSAQPSGVHLGDISQNATYVGGTKQKVPCLLRNTQVWNLNADRPLLPRELLGVMGLHAVRFQAAMDNLDLTENDIRHLCGNGLHTSVVAAVFMWAAVNSC